MYCIYIAEHDEDDKEVGALGVEAPSQEAPIIYLRCVALLFLILSLPLLLALEDKGIFAILHFGHHNVISTFCEGSESITYGRTDGVGARL